MPPFLKAGDTIGIVSTARKISREAIQPAIAILKDWGFKVKSGITIGAERNQFAGSDELRIQDFQSMADDPEVAAILCAKGGYGTIRIIDQLDFTSFHNQPKWIAGYSDVTVLHAHMNNVLGLPSIHCLMPSGFPEAPAEKASVNSILETLTGRTKTISADTHPLNQNGWGEGKLIGGNLSMLYNLIGSKEDFEPNGKLLFIEEVDEYLYHVDRMLWGLKRAGKFKWLRGLIVGGMTDMNDNEIPYGQTAEEIIYHHTEAFDFPVCFGFPAGHHEHHLAFYLGTQIRLDVHDTGSRVHFST